ncbi:MAG: hypothetical protein QXK76_01660 [Candidatus Woesearchaeota archaeon]
MDDRKVYELTRLKLAYTKQIIFIAGLILLLLMGIILYIINIYSFDFALFIVSVMLILTGLIGIMTIDQKMKTISKKIKEL